MERPLVKNEIHVTFKINMKLIAGNYLRPAARAEQEQQIVLGACC